MQKKHFWSTHKTVLLRSQPNLLLKSRCLMASWKEESRWKDVGVLGAGSGAMREPFRSSGLGWEYQAHSGGSSHTTDFAVPWLGLLGTISLPSLDTPGFELSGLLSFFKGNPITVTVSTSCRLLVSTFHFWVIRPGHKLATSGLITSLLILATFDNRITPSKEASSVFRVTVVHPNWPLHHTIHYIFHVSHSLPLLSIYLSHENPLSMVSKNLWWKFIMVVY